MRLDEVGLVWQNPVAPKTGKAGRVQGPRTLPPIPDTGWKPPGNLPSLASAKRIALDIETYDPGLTSLGPGPRRDGYIVGVSIATDDGFKGYFPVRHKSGANMDPAAVFGWLKKELARERQEKVGANIIYDLDFLGTKEGVEVAGTIRDVQIAEPLLDENRRFYNLDSLAKEYLGEGKKKEWLESAYGAKWPSHLWEAPLEVVGPYAEADADQALRILALQEERMRREGDGLPELFDLECDLIPMLADMRRRGVAVDIAAAAKLEGEFNDTYKQALADIKSITGGTLDIWSAEAIAHAFDKLEVPYPRTEKKEAPSFVKQWLLEHCPHPLGKLIATARGVDKLRGTFIDSYINKHQVNGRLHCEFNQLRGDKYGTVSGRFSSSNPNLQNIPVRDETWGRRIRSLFIPDEGEEFSSLDWSQIEYRLIVHFGYVRKIAGADVARQMYLTNPKTDFHAAIAEMTGLERAAAKSINFGIAYGEGEEKLAFLLGVSRDEARSLLRDYETRAPFVKGLFRQAMDYVAKHGEIRTLLRRRRHFPHFEERIKNDKGVWEEVITLDKGRGVRAFTHAALNALIQGSAADIMKKAMVLIRKSGVASVLGCPLLTVHDELAHSVPKTKAGREAIAEVRRIMETCVSLAVPLRADGKLGPNWGATK